MTYDLMQLGAGLVLLVGGGRALVSSAAALANQLGVSALVIGLTVVAFGTSAPELAVNAIAAIRGSGEVAFGNLMGSNIANIGLVVGIAAIVRPLTIQGIVITREIPMMLLASLAVLIMGADFLRGDSTAEYDRTEALLLFLFFGIFLYYTIGDTVRQRLTDPFVEQLERRRIPERDSLIRTSAVIVAGLVMLTAGGHFTVEGAVGVAEALGIPSSIIGLTLIAVGTSLPELTTSIIAARRGETDLAVGNIVGSNIFNLLFVLGVTASIHPVPIPARGFIDLLAVVVMSALLWIVCSAYGGRRVTHAEGWLLLAIYVVYMVGRASAFINAT
jgi:cation:H+ antiporter